MLAAFAAVLLLSLVLTAATFWLQIRLLNTQRVRTDLQGAAPTVRTSVNRVLVQYWQTSTGLPELRRQLVAVARTAGVRILLTDYCSYVPIDTESRMPLRRVPSQTVPLCSQVLDDTVGSADPRPFRLNVTSVGQVQEANLPDAGPTFYLAYQAPFFSYAPSQQGSARLLVRTVIVAKSPDGVDQHALTSILPQLAAAGICSLALTLLVVLLIVRAITRPLQTITAASEHMARGDYDQRVPEAGDDEVGQLARSFNRMAAEVNSARELQRQFIANVSHDLKTPLTSILGFSQILSESEGVAASPSQRRAAHVINEEARRLQRLTLDLLDLSRLEAGQLRLQRGPCDINALAGAALLRYRDLPANATITFHDERSQGSLMVAGDADRLMQVLVNLLDNAVKFCDSSGSIAMRTERNDTELRLAVANTGSAIAEEDAARIFQRFYRTDHSRATRTGGTGLGLAIVREIVVAHGGQVSASSEDGWTRFTLILPAYRGAEPVDRRKALRDTEPDPVESP